MAKKKHSTDDVIDAISEIRAHNNKLWMSILRLGFTYAPKDCRKIMKMIVKNDKEITKWLGEL